MQYGLIGEHLAHSYSREIHAKIADYTYELCEIAPADLGAFLTRRDFRAINVTIPYKQDVIPYLDEISEEAAHIGAVNTVVSRGGRLCGYNTDFAGLSYLVRRTGLDLCDKKVLILGTGGTSKTALAVAKAAGAKTVLRVSRRAGGGAVTYEEACRDHTDADILINTTPVGMYPKTEGSPIDLACFPHLCGVLDAIYHPLRTNLVLEAAARGIPAAGGLAMLVAQGVYASALFEGKTPEPDIIDRVTREIEAEKRNIVLIGMPSSGKTTIGKRLAKELQRPFTDTDEAVVARIGMPIADYFATHGEAAFRQAESEVVNCVSRMDGQIIATGGGVVLNKNNVRELRQNGVLVFLDRALERLTPTADRPLSAGREALAALFAARAPLYRLAADVTVDGNGDPEEVTELVRKELES